ncbi:hypothetical protein QE152_g8628 [Popillia japonica]|uniref:Uncharacterized protein n=1 Tax=Popillia japonica TaxID=7064 RepID=A0AAW1M1J3_POPJA
MSVTSCVVSDKYARNALRSAWEKTTTRCPGVGVKISDAIRLWSASPPADRTSYDGAVEKIEHIEILLVTRSGASRSV